MREKARFAAKWAALHPPDDLEVSSFTTSAITLQNISGPGGKAAGRI